MKSPHSKKQEDNGMLQWARLCGTRMRIKSLVAKVRRKKDYIICREFNSRICYRFISIPRHAVEFSASLIGEV